MDEIVVHRFQRPWFYSPILYLFSPMFYQRLLIARWLRNYTLKIIKNRKRIFNSETFSNTSVDEDVDTDSGCKDKKRLSFLDTLLSANTRHEIDMNGIQEEVDTVVFAVSPYKINFNSWI